MVAQRKFPDHENHGGPIPNTDLKALPVAVFYGANGAGKSNLIKAIKFALELMDKGGSPKASIPIHTFRFGGAEEKPSKFEFRFFRNSKVFGYGFEVEADRVCSEWLDIYNGDKPQSLFERAIEKEGDQKIEISDSLKKDSEKVAQLGQLGVLRNQLFIAAVRHTIEAENQGEFVRTLLDWTKDFVIIEPDTHFDAEMGIWMARNDYFRDFVSSYICAADTGLSGLGIYSTPLGSRVSEAKKQELKAQLQTDPNALIDCDIDPQKHIPVGLNKEGELVIFDTVGVHKTESGKEVALPLGEESDGTQRLAELLVGLSILRADDVILIIDEIDRSLHPLLAKKFIEYFLSFTKCKSQILLTTHETHLLDLSLLRRDEIWFAEKNAAGATHIYPLADFPVRKDLRVEKGYLLGRFGAIPFLGAIDSLKAPPPEVPNPELQTS